MNIYQVVQESTCAVDVLSWYRRFEMLFYKTWFLTRLATSLVYFFTRGFLTLTGAGVAGTLVGCATCPSTFPDG